MTILCDRNIRDFMKAGLIQITDFDDSMINPASIDFRLGNKFGVIQPKQEVKHKQKQRYGGLGFVDDPFRTYTVDLPIDPSNKDSFSVEYVERDEYKLGPGEFIIASSLESITIPNNLCFITKGKSSLGRLGLANSDQAGFVDPGWSGFITLELYNHSRNTILLKAGMRIGQWVFYVCSVPDKAYGEVGRYQGQGPAAGSKGI